MGKLKDAIKSDKLDDEIMNSQTDTIEGLNAKIKVLQERVKRLGVFVTIITAVIIILMALGCELMERVAANEDVETQVEQDLND